MKQTFDKEKSNRIPWTVVGIVFVAVIAVITDTDAGTLATRLHRIRKKLYQYIIQKEHGR